MSGDRVLERNRYENYRGRLGLNLSANFVNKMLMTHGLELHGLADTREMKKNDQVVTWLWTHKVEGWTLSKFFL